MCNGCNDFFVGQSCIVVFDYLYLVVNFISIVDINVQFVYFVVIKYLNVIIFQFSGRGIRVRNSFFDLVFNGSKSIDKMCCS